MGLTQSALKKEVAALQQEARKRSAKHQEELATAAKDKRQLQAKIDELQALVAQAKEDAELAKKKACEQEERMKALKWELVRQLRLTGSPTSSCQRAPLSPSPSTRIDLNWRLNDDLSVRQSVGSPKKSPESPKEAPDLTGAITTTTNLLAPRRSLLKRSEPSSSAPIANQTPDVDAKQVISRSSSSERKTSSDDYHDSLSSEVRQDDSGNDKSPREFKTESGSDDSPPKSHRSNDAKAAEEEEDATPLAKHHYQNADGKDSGDESPEINDIRCYSEDKSV
ncbi:hypothetical protein GN958_ATG06026 [Phytophthora infestans]|uniref:Uncharacterized protein n=1 Tax=Phytophthora infestans TaxID=4787 RepID=A0A8S9V349_PHYIN|nr:hypothetical protein GN958_ATG06026 [Phytophthora infestans]